jgi:hypothetical protein
MNFFRLAARFHSVFNMILFSLPIALGGHYLRRVFWRSHFAYCGGRVIFGNCLVIAGFSAIKIDD